MCLQLTTVSTTVNIYEWDTGLNSLCYFIFTQSWDPCDSCFSEYQSRAQFAQSHTALNGRLIQTQQGTVAALKRQTALCQPSLSIFSLPQGNWLLWVLHNSGQEVLLTPLQRAPKAATHSHGTVHWPGTQEQSTAPSTSLPENTATGNISSHNPHWLTKPGGGSENSLWPRGESRVHVFFSALVFLVIYKF